MNDRSSTQLKSAAAGQATPPASIKRTTGESSSPTIKPMKQLMLLSSPVITAGNSSADSPSRSSMPLQSTMPVNESPEVSSAKTVHSCSLAETEQLNPLKIKLKLPPLGSIPLNMRVPTKRRTPKKAEREADRKIQEEATETLQMLSVNTTEMGENLETLSPSKSSFASWRSGNKEMALTISDMHVKIPTMGKDENELVSRKGKEKVWEKSIKETEVVCKKNEDPPSVGDSVDQPNVKGGYNLRKRKPNQILRVGEPTNFEKMVTRSVTRPVENKITVKAKKESRNKKKVKEVGPGRKNTKQLVIPLTKEEIAEDFFALTASRASRNIKKRRPEVQRDIDRLCPPVLEFIISADAYLK